MVHRGSEQVDGEKVSQSFCGSLNESREPQ